MDVCTIMLALAGDSGNTIEKYKVTPAEIAVLRLIHGEDAVYDIRVTGEIERDHKAELARLHGLYSRPDERGRPDPKSPVVGLFPGAAARVYEKVAELEVPDEFYAAEKRATPKRDPLDHDGDGKKGGSKKKAKAAKPDPEPEQIEPEPDVDAEIDNDGIDEMPDKDIFG